MINLPQDFLQSTWSPTLEEAALPLIRMALQEDLGGQRDWSTWVSVPEPLEAKAKIVCRESGVVSGLKLLPMIQAELAELTVKGAGGSVPETTGRWRLCASDGDRVERGTVVARWDGPAAPLLTMERTVLNFLGRLSGISTQTRHFVDAVVGTGTEIYDTRKTTPGWRLLEKYAVRCGGGRNHRLGLYSAIMLKDNHLASRLGGTSSPGNLREIIASARAKMALAKSQGLVDTDLIFQVEVDSLAQLAVVLHEDVDLILLDNMTLHELRQALTMRESSKKRIPLEASGGINLANVAQVAGTGVDRISVGSLTHSVTTLDLGLDWGE
ncbi:MAG: carboxylating nicotinate-nucleotide diphosphorylase [Planctomycetaceae bacterium]|nr:carboxylating nicotinate-nucleotide diphosphorylase [Planctomycetaceae bacterium]